MTLSTSENYKPHSLWDPSSVDSSSGGDQELLANVQINQLNENNDIDGRCAELDLSHQNQTLTQVYRLHRLHVQTILQADSESSNTKK